MSREIVRSVLQRWLTKKLDRGNAWGGVEPLESRTLLSTTVDHFGDEGWNSGDTRVNGINATLQSDIDSRLQFAAAPAGALQGPGGLRLITPLSTDKATLERVGNLGSMTPSLTASFAWYKASGAAPALKIGFVTGDPIPASTRIGEENWDKLLVYEPALQPAYPVSDNNTWITESISWTSGNWWLVDRNLAPANTHINQDTPQALAWWFSNATDPVYAAKLAGATISTIQLGMGSGATGADAWIDYLNVSLLADAQNFETVNAAPTLAGANHLYPVSEDDSNNQGTRVAALVDGLIDDPSGPARGIAIIAADTTNGSWQFTIDGANWQALGTPSTSAARLLSADADTRVRFIPNADFNGTVANALTFRAWDASNGLAEGAVADTATNGGSTAFSAAAASPSIIVYSLADAPRFTVAGGASLTVSQNAGAQSVAGWVSSFTPGSSNPSITGNGYPTVIEKPGLSVDVIDIATIPQSIDPNTGTLKAARTNFTSFAPDGSGRIFVNDMRGKLWIISGGAVLPTPFLDIPAVRGANWIDNDSAINSERGFSTFAFHPDFNNPLEPGYRKVYTVHTETPASAATGDFPLPWGTNTSYDVLSEWTVSAADPNLIDTASRREILRLPDPRVDHNMNQIAFNSSASPGSADYGMLYIGVGDGGNTGNDGPLNIVDQYANGQNRLIPYGKILRIDPLGNNSPNGAYGIPTDNPFVGAADSGNTTLDEIWALGFRNPQRFSWDSVTGKMLIGDIGQKSAEEVNIGVAGGNYGWSEREGFFVVSREPASQTLSFRLPANDATLGYIYPAATYDRSEGIAIVGGFVYRGSAIPYLEGKYIFGDLNTGRIYYADVNDLVNGAQANIRELTLFSGGVQKTLLQILGGGASRTDMRFGLDAGGELYITTKFDGKVRKLAFRTQPATYTPPSALPATAGPANLANTTAAFTVSNLTNAGLFSVAPAVAPDGTLTFTPAANAAGTATFVVTATDAGGTNFGRVNTSAPQTFTIQIIAPEIAVSGNANGIADGDSTPSAADHTDFGSVVQGGTVVTRTFTVTNTGGATLTLGIVTVPTGFDLGADALITSLAPGATDTFTVLLTTATAGTLAGDVSFATNDVDESTFNFRVSGTVSSLTNTKPTITSISGSPGTVNHGSTLTLTANGVADPNPGDAVTVVEFYRDANANAVLDVGVDSLLGTDTNGVDGWSLAVNTAGLPTGTGRYFARASDGELWSSTVTTTGVVNALPTIAAIAAGPTIVIKGDNVTVTATGAGDTAPGVVSAVEFYRDVNGNNQIDPATDVSLGSDTSGADGWSKVISTSSFPTGTVTILARTRDNNSGYSQTVSTTTFVNAKPTIGSLADSPDPLIPGNVLTLTAGTVADTDGTVTSVEFYRDVNNNSLIDVGIDELLGNDTLSGDGWSLAVPGAATATFPASTSRYMARAQDNLGAWSTARTRMGVVSNPPVVTTLSVSPDPVNKGSTLTLTATGVSDPDAGQSVASVSFYRDSNNNGVWESGDLLLGTDASSSGGWSYAAATGSFPTGTVRLFARAKDSTNVNSTVQASATVLVNALPTIGTLTDSPDPLIPGSALTLVAGTVADADGTVASVEFYRDVNNNSLIDIGTDDLLGTDAVGGDGWSVVVSGAVTSAFPTTGTSRYMARAQDNLGAWSTARTSTGVVSNPPVVTTLSVSPGQVNKGANITLTATGVSDPDAGQTIVSVTFYRDSNNNGIWESTDTALNTDTNGTDGWSWTGSTSSFPTGTVRLFARAKDNLGMSSTTAATTTVYINALPVLTVSSTSLAYTSGSSAALLASTGTVSDANSTDFDTGKLTVLITAGGTSFDRLGIRNQGIGAGLIGVSGVNVLYGGVVIGTWSGGTDGFTPLIISFNANATVAAAQALARNITYFNGVLPGADTGTRSIAFTLTDGDGGVSNTAIRTVNVT